MRMAWKRHSDARCLLIQQDSFPSAAACACTEMSRDLLLITGSGAWWADPRLCADVALCLEERSEFSFGLGIFIFTRYLWMGWNVSLLPHTSRQSQDPASEPQITTFPG